MNLHHINITAPRELLEQEKIFFCEILGLQEGNRPNFSSKGYWLYADNKAVVHLTESETIFDSNKQGYIDHVAVQTSNLKMFIQTLNDREINYTTVYLPEIELTQVFVNAPSNTGIEINFKNEKI